MEIINFKKKNNVKKMKLLPEKQEESYENARISYIVQKNFKINI